MARRLPLLGFSFLLAAAASAQTAGTCVPGAAVDTLAGNAVRAQLYNTGGLFYSTGASLYRVPVVPDEPSAVPNAIFAATLWVGGTVDGEPRLSAATYRNRELWPGPLDDGGTLPNPNDCTPYDRIWRVSRADVRQFYAAGTATPDLSAWPVGLGAPAFVDANRNTVRDAGEPMVTPASRAQTLNPAAGEVPLVLGEATAWWVMNDVGGDKRSTSSKPIGLEVRVEAFALPSADAAVDQATLYRYTLVNRSTKPLADAYVGMWTDADIGNLMDDFVGSDSTRSLVYTYNGDPFDEGTDGYGTPPPAVGFRVLGGPLVAAPGSTWTDPDGAVFVGQRRLPLTAALLFDASHEDAFNPAAPFLNTLRGRLPNGTPMRACGSGDSPPQPLCPVTAFVYGGDPVTGQGWTPRGPNPGEAPLHPPGDRKMLGAAGPFALAPGETQTFSFAYVFARGTSHLASVTALRAASDRVQAAWDEGAYHRGAHEAVLPAVSEMPTLLAPASGATGQPSPVSLLWETSSEGGITAYDVQLSRDGTFTERDVQTVRSLSARFAFVPDSTGQPVYWRVRAVAARSTGAESAGPWSEAWSFASTPRTVAAPAYRFEFQTVANAAGPLVPPESGALGSAGFPVPSGRVDPDGTRQQSTGRLRPDQGWVIHVASQAAGEYASWWRSVSNDGANASAIYSASYEWRFTGASKAADYFTLRNRVLDVPFELWSLGADVASPSDDVRMIPLVCDGCFSAGGDVGTFAIGGDSPVSAGIDPMSDPVYWHYPVDRTPGQGGYLAYESRAGTSAAQEYIGEEVWMRTSLVGVNFGASDYPMALPEPGTVFRLLRTVDSGNAPALVSPADGAVLGGPTATLRWIGGAAVPLSFNPGTPVEFQVARDAAFTDLVRHDTMSVDSYAMPVVVSLPEAGRYVWRVRHQNLAGTSAPWSEAWAFSVGTGTAGEAVEAPRALALDAPRPNPSRGTAHVRVGLPEGGLARVELYDMLGRCVAVTHEGALSPGWSDVSVETRALAPGVYVVRLVTAGGVLSRPLVVAR